MTDHSERENVVRLNAERKGPAEVALARLPAAMHTLRDKARQQLQGVLRELFEKADDALFELADKAVNNQEQNLYFDSMREVRLRRRAVEATFFRKIDIHFARLLNPEAHSDEVRPEKDDISLDDLALVQNDELEEMVAVEGLTNKVNEQFAEPIQHLTMRIDHLVPVKVYQKNNPLGGDAICGAFVEAMELVEADVKAKLVLFKLFDKLLMSALEVMYQSLNQLLVDANILPSLKTARVKKTTQATPPGERYGAGASAADSAQTAGYDAQADEILHTLRDLLGRGGQARGAAPAASSGASVEIDSGALVSLLSQAQHQGVAQPASGEVRPVDVRALLNDLLNRQQQGAAINQVDEDVINLVSMMFEFILDDRNLAAPVKALLGRLQIPMIKVAIADKSFFSKGGHPARRLLNEMATAALGWQESGEATQRRDGLYSKLESIVGTIISDFEADMGIFNTLLLDFRSFLEKDRRRAQILEQRTIDAEDGKAKSERARAQVDATLAQLVGDRAMPSAADRLLRDAWANVMFIDCLKHGTESEQWQASLETARILVWSAVAPLDQQSRQKLLKTVPVLLQKLRQGLESIAFNPFKMTQMFKQLEALHLERLRDAARTPVGEAPRPTVAAPQPRQPAADNVVEPAAQEPVAEAPRAPAVAPPVVAAPAAPAAAPRTEAASELPEKLSEQAAAEAVTQPMMAAVSPAEPTQANPDDGDRYLTMAANVTQGSWFEMQGEAGQKYRCRLAAIIKATGKYIFVNRSGMKVAEETRNGLALALQSGRLRLLDDSMLFDRALESVIGNLRASRTSSA